MAFLSRANIPAEFEDRTSAVMLHTPVPQFLYHRLFEMAVNAGFNELADLGNDLNKRVTAAIGTSGSSSVPSLEDQMLRLDDPMFAGVVKVVPELSAKVGQTIRVNRQNYSAVAAMSVAPDNRMVVQGQVISTTPTTFGTDQISVTVRRYGGPYGTSAIQPFGFDQFDSSFQIHRAASLVGPQLKYDWAHFIDNFISLLFNQGATAIYSNPGYTATTAFYNGASVTPSSYGGEAPLSYQALRVAEATADTNNIPTFADGCRMLVVPPIGLQELEMDPLFVKLVAENAKNPIYGTAYKGRISKTHIFESTTLPTTTNGQATSTVYIAHYFSPDVIAAGMAMPAQCALSSANNYGLQALMIWLAEFGMVLADSRFVFPIYFN